MKECEVCKKDIKKSASIMIFNGLDKTVKYFCSMNCYQKYLDKIKQMSTF